MQSNGSCPTGPRVTVAAHFRQGKIESIDLNVSDKIGMHWEIFYSKEDQPLVDILIDWLNAYAAGKGVPWTGELEQPRISPFSKQVYAFLSSIPSGRIATYGEVAKALGSPKAARAVGRVCGANRFPLLIPCHRVVTATHQLGGFSQPLEVKRRLLEFEGVGTLLAAPLSKEEKEAAMLKITKTQLLKKLGYLEFINDQLSSELRYVDTLLRAIGFPEGLETVKIAAKELQEKNNGQEEQSEPGIM